MKIKTLLLTLMVFAVYLLHQDSWNWKRAEPLVFGFLPIGLAYQAGYSILAAVMMAVLVKFAWPKDLEELSESGPPRPPSPLERGHSGPPHPETGTGGQEGPRSDSRHNPDRP